MNHVNFSETVECHALALAFSNLRQGFSDSESRKPGHGWISTMCQRHLLSRFSNLGQGMLTVSEGGQKWKLGKSRNHGSRQELSASIYVNRPEFYRRILLGGTIGAAESFIDGVWDTDDLTAVIRIVIQNMKKMHRLENSLARVRNTVHWMKHQLRRNTRTGSRRNIEEHYDLGNDFYSLFLDRTMNYSSGIFPTPVSSMLEASLTKMDWIGHKLQLKPSDHVLEIGTGWGGLAIHLARNFGCRVTTTTISKQQYEYAKQQVADAGLESQITLLLSDYRDLKGSYDKIVSIEMIEAVGHQYFDKYFGKCSSLLNSDGLMLIQAITMSQQNYEHHINNIDFIRRYVFPGGCLPSIVAIGQSVGRSTDMRTVHQEDITEHYVKTLQKWLHEFHLQMSKIRHLGYDQAFIRLWHFYLCYCEAAFAERRVHNVQMVFAKPKSPIDPANHFSGYEPQISRLANSKPRVPALRVFEEHCLEANS